MAAELESIFLWSLTFHKNLWAEISQVEKLLFRARPKALEIYNFIHSLIHLFFKSSKTGRIIHSVTLENSGQNYLFLDILLSATGHSARLEGKSKLEWGPPLL